MGAAGDGRRDGMVGGMGRRGGMAVPAGRSEFTVPWGGGALGAPLFWSGIEMSLLFRGRGFVHGGWTLRRGWRCVRTRP